jgi:hypothetical protein
MAPTWMLWRAWTATWAGDGDGSWSWEVLLIASAFCTLDGQEGDAGRWRRLVIVGGLDGRRRSGRSMARKGMLGLGVWYGRKLRGMRLRERSWASAVLGIIRRD